MMNQYLPEIFALLMGLAIFIYLVLDGFDLGVGILFPWRPDDRDTMITTIGPFWDGNETWLVLGLGVLLAAFPNAYSEILPALYVPIFMMLIGLIMRGAAFEFRAKASGREKTIWDWVFAIGSTKMAFWQGLMVGCMVLGFPKQWWNGFTVFVGLAMIAAYAQLGSTWLMMRTEGSLRSWARRRAELTVWILYAALAAVSIVTPLYSDHARTTWLDVENINLLALPLIAAALLPAYLFSLRNKKRTALPFLLTIAILACAFAGFGATLWPYMIIDKMTVTQAAAGLGSLKIIATAVMIVLPAVIAYTIYSYWLFWSTDEKIEH
jgi:cytochrome d ubiquinol oxidase subunit II